MQNIYQNSDPEGRRSGQDRRASDDPSYQGREKHISKDRRKGIQKRKSPRFRAKEGSYVAVSNYNLIGFIKNINKSGLAFQYVANGKKLTGMLTLDLFRTKQEFKLKNVLFNVVSDFYVQNDIPFSNIILRQCRGNFVDLTDYQKLQLDHFIQNFTLGKV